MSATAGQRISHSLRRLYVLQARLVQLLLSFMDWTDFSRRIREPTASWLQYTGLNSHALDQAHLLRWAKTELAYLS